MASTNNKIRALRQRNQKVNYAEPSGPEVEQHNSDSDHSWDAPSRQPTKKRSKTLSPRAVEPIVDTTACSPTLGAENGRSSAKVPTGTELVDSGVDVTVRNPILGRGRGGRGRRGGRGGGRGGQRGTCWGRPGTQDHGSQEREVEENINNETGNDGLRSVVENGPPSSEGQALNTKGASPSPLEVRSNKRTILSWLIDNKLIKEDERVGYVGLTMTGRITRGGIFCDCCQSEISVWTFEKHAGSDLGQPYEHIYLINKSALLQEFLITAWHGPEETKRRDPFLYVPKENAGEQNDACSICGDGGGLVCCEKCPSTYHSSCMDMERVPFSDWLCPYCICKYCGLGGESKEFITCSQCDKKIHWACFINFEKEFLKETLDPGCARLYCGPGCREIYEKLGNSVGVRNDIFASYSWTVIHRTDIVSPSGNPYLENNLKVAIAWMLMNEAFATIIDNKTGIDVVQSIVYSCRSTLRRVDFSRFYTVVLEKDDGILAAASMRFHGRGIVEMPFIATDKAYRGQGFCRLLMREIESFLFSLQVKTLVIPSVPETVGMWTQKFNFNVVSREMNKSEKISSYNILMLPGATMLYKDLSAGIPDVIHDSADNLIEGQNGGEPQRAQPDRSRLDLNLVPCTPLPDGS